MKLKLIIFASGSGTNAENIINYFKKHEKVEVTQVLTNNRQAKVLDRANRLGIPSRIFSKKEMNDIGFTEQLKAEADLIVLAGFLLKIPDALVNAFPNRIINIHPALLPKYGGKGMYGQHVHQAVVANEETESGITIHYVNENYDEGAIIFQAAVKLLKTDTPNDVAQKIHLLEQKHFPQVIEQKVISKLI